MQTKSSKRNKIVNLYTKQNRQSLYETTMKALIDPPRRFRKDGDKLNDTNASQAQQTK